MGRTVEIISAGESFEVSARDRTYQGKAPVTAFKVDGNVAPGAAGQVQFAAAPSIGGVVQAVASGYLLLGFTGLASAGAVTLTGVKVGDIVVSVANTTDGTDGSTNFETKITVANQIQQSGTTLSAKKFTVLIAKQS